MKFPPQKLREAPAIIAGDDFTKLLMEVDEPYRMMIGLIAATGLRIGELPRNVQELGRVTWHQFRHIHSSLLNDLRVPVKIAQEQLGHASISTTLNIYTHVVDASHRAAIEQVERQLFPTVPKSQEADSASVPVSATKRVG